MTPPPRGWCQWEIEGDRGGWLNFLPGGALELDTVPQRGLLPDRWRQDEAGRLLLIHGDQLVDTLAKDPASDYWVNDDPRHYLVPAAELLTASKQTPWVGGVYTLNRYDLLEESVASLLQGSLVPPIVYVIDNGGGLSQGFLDRHARQAAVRDVVINLIRPRSNLGIPASCNLIGRLAAGGDTLLFNDDLTFGPDTVLNLRRAREKMACACNGSCLVMDRAVWEIVGDYDERFWPGYYDDSDYRLRCRRAGIKIGHIRDKTLRHVGTATGTTHEHYAVNERLFRRKWRIGV